MIEEDLKLKLKKELSKDLKKGILLFDKYINYSSDLYDEYVILEGRFHQTIRDFSQNIITKEERDLSLDKLRVVLLELIKKLKDEDIQLSSIEKQVSFKIPKERKEGIYAYRINDIAVKKIANKLERESHSVLFRIGYLGNSNKFNKIDSVIKKVRIREDVWDWHCAVFNHYGNRKYLDMFNEFYILKNAKFKIDKRNTTTQLFYVFRENIISKFISILTGHGVPINNFVQILFVGYIRNFQFRDEFPKWDNFLDTEYNYYKNLDLDAAIIIDMDKIHFVEVDVISLFKSISKEIIDQTNGKYLYIGKGFIDLNGKDITDYTEIDDFGSKFYSNCQE